MRLPMRAAAFLLSLLLLLPALVFADETHPEVPLWVNGALGWSPGTP
jgi:hypothetical protein